MKSVKTSEQILKDYEKELDELYDEMARIFLRAQRKIEDSAYRETLEKLETIKQQ